MLVRYTLTNQSTTKAFTISEVIVAIVFIVVCICALGVTYNNLRFLANYQVTKTKVIDCTRTLRDSSQYSQPYYVFNLYVKIEGIKYTIEKKVDVFQYSGLGKGKENQNTIG